MTEKLGAVKSNGNIINGDRGFCVFVSKDGSVHKEPISMSVFSKPWIDSSVCWIDYAVEEAENESMKAALSLGFSETLVLNLMKNKRSGYEDFGSEMGLLLPAITVKGFDVKLNPLLILIKQNLIVTVHTLEVTRFTNLRRYAETVMKKLPGDMPIVDKMTHLLVRLIDENNSRNFEHLLEIEEQGDALSEKLANIHAPRQSISTQIHEMKHALITYLGGLWATVDVLSSVRFGDAELLSDDLHILDKITALMEEVNSHIGLAEHLSEVLASGLEVVQSIYNNELQILNNRLSLMVSYLTIVATAFMVPNTIATMMGTSFFNDFGPKDRWWFITLLSVLTVLSGLFAWVLMKKLGLLPKKPQGD